MITHEGATLFHLFDPEFWTFGHTEANAHLFVSWDALELPDVGAHLWHRARPLTCTATGYLHCIRAERELIEWAWGTLSRAGRLRARREFALLFLDPVLEQVCPTWDPGSAVPVGASIELGELLDWGPGRTRTPQTLTTWRAWLRGALALRRKAGEDWRRESETADSTFYAISGLWGFPVEDGAHGLAPFAYAPTWGELLDIMRWVLCMIWLSELKQESL